MPSKIKTTKKNILVICVDRDNDIGEKAGIKGPIIGRDDNISMAVKLGISDPSESDVNAVFQAVKVYDEIKEEIKDAQIQVATLTGDRQVGLISDRIIESQLDSVLNKYKCEEVVFVSDGESDEHIIPIIKSKLKIPNVYVERVIVKQNRYLEGAYYMAYDFLSSVVSNKDMSRTFFGIPALMLILYAIFGITGWRIIIGILGLFLLIKGFQLEPYISRFIDELSLSAKSGQISFFAYIVSITFLVVGVIHGYSASASATGRYLLVISEFLNKSIFVFFLSAVFLGMGVLLHYKSKNYTRYLSYFVSMFSVSWIVYAITLYIINSFSGIEEVIYALVISGFLIFLTFSLEKSHNLAKIESVKNKTAN